MTLRLIIFIVLLFSSHIYAASYDCNLPGLIKVEMDVCSDSRLTRLDDVLADLYSTYAQQPDMPDFSFTSLQNLKDEQLIWLRERNKCKDDACILNAYIKRINKLSTLIRTRRHSTGAKKVHELINDYLKNSIYRIALDGLSIPYYYQSGESIRLFFVAMAEGAFNQLDRDRRGWCKGDNDKMIGYIEYQYGKGIVEKRMYIGNACPPDMAVPMLFSDQDGIHVIAYEHVSEKYRKVFTLKEIWSSSYVDYFPEKVLRDEKPSHVVSFHWSNLEEIK